MSFSIENQKISTLINLLSKITLIIIISYTSKSYCQNKNSAEKNYINNSVREKKFHYSFSNGTPIKLEELLTFTESQNPQLQSAYRRWKAAQQKASQAKYLPDPRISYGYFTEEVQTRTGPQEHKFGISQTIPWLGKLTLKEKIALKEAEAVYQDYVKIRLKLIQNIKTAFYEYSFLFNSLIINKQHLEILKAMEQIASIRFKSGSLPQSNLIQIQIEQGKIEDRIKELESLRAPLSAKIYASLGTSPSGILPWPDTIENEISEFDTESLNPLMLEHNPSLKITEILKKRQEYTVKLADTQFYPDLTFGLEKIHISGADDPMIAMFSINLPLWWGKLNAEKKEALENRESIAESFTDEKNQLSAKLDLFIYEFQDARRKERFYMNTLIPKAQQAIDVALKGFETGKVTFADLLDAERSLLEFQLTQKRQEANSYIRLAEIEAMIGKELQFIHQTNRKD